MTAQVHSVPVDVPAAPCEVAVGRAHPRLRGLVLGYSGFRSGIRAPIAHRLLALSYTTVIVDFDSPCGLVTGPRAGATTHGDTAWGHGVSVGLTPDGVAALFGLPMSELTGATVPLSRLLGPRATELPGRLAAEPSWRARYGLLDAVLAESLRAAGTGPAPVVAEAWRRLQRPGPVRVGELAEELGTTRRRLERGFRAHIGLAPKAVARIARFQRAAAQVGLGVPLSAAAAGNGYADQPHLTREIRALAGVTPVQLRALFRHEPLPGAHSFKTGVRAPA
ncbi:putative AraC-family regulatory protein [Paractinoplanes deccanensis]|uniref:AraC-family regulatory protein n=1 Tax=Paractinoplanes deccanensis TaxID=113561 RepID=A0ABQ3Y550_9ACTN|nr:AraC family transcriptional regulator [Actinoplanes deccanensis]GID75121.1 putative AraC-family regulatory protein [Actinoplanes deccanensis]